MQTGITLTSVDLLGLRPCCLTVMQALAALRVEQETTSTLRLPWRRFMNLNPSVQLRASSNTQFPTEPSDSAYTRCFSVIRQYQLDTLTPPWRGHLHPSSTLQLLGPKSLTLDYATQLVFFDPNLDSLSVFESRF